MKINLTKSTEDYLEALYIFSKESDDNSVHSLQVAKFLGVSKPAVTKAMNNLANEGYILKSLYGTITLTEKGKEIGMVIYDKHCTLKNFLINIGVTEENASIDCCKMEHVISNETFLKIKEFNNKITTNK
ncbi:MAG: metal-dependent transcriptional regulator [Firmicutes bacterium]|uniref:Metal-dependent transcriptional regulator n=1 Tax=Candidatus Onthovivens merdipullorum TaxID=2840889 RepID=A0A9D9DII8_9BACL|nr:metal-dependent transcriptional regulator [Candidatus Onthovivens merdipullorum]